MKPRIAVILTLIVTLSCLSHAAAGFKAGAAMRIVTPEKMLPVSGGMGEPDATTQKIGDLTARALVIENNGVRVAIVSTDFLGFNGVLGGKVRDQVKDVPRENIIIGATHTHSAPDTYAFADEKGQTAADMEYLDHVCTLVAEAINEAVENLRPAVLKIAEGKAEGKIAYNYYAPELYDHRMGVIQVLSAKGKDKGKPIATLVNYATHPEVIGAGQGILCPDLVGPLYDRLNEKGAGLGVFMNSAQGGMVTADCRGPEKDIQTWDECIRIGNLMADEAVRLIESAKVQEDPEVFCAATNMSFPVDSPVMRHVLENSPMKYPVGADGRVTAQVNVVNLGNSQILTIPGEALPNIGFYLKRKMNGRHNFLFGLTNEAFGYILTKTDFGSFERYNYISRTSLGEMTGEILIDESLKFVNSCPKPKGLDEK